MVEAQAKIAERTEDHRESLEETLLRQRAACEAERPVSLEVRRDRLRRAVGILVDNETRLSDAMAEDFGVRPGPMSGITDIATSILALKHAIRHVRKWMRPERRSADFPLGLLGARARIDYQPLGVVGVISPWNFPVFLTFGPLAGILSAGNRCMIKPSEFTPTTSDLMAELIAGAFDETEITVCTGGPEVGAAFSSLPFDHLLFTGSTSVGRHIMRAAADNLVPVTLELGGKSPVIIGRDADIPGAVDRCVIGKTINAGQVCLAPDYILVPRDRLEMFVSAFRTSTAGMFPTIANNDDYTSVINVRHYERLRGLVDEARERGTRIEEINPAGESFDDAETCRMPPVLLIEPDDDLAVMKEEIFGPVLPVKTYTDIDEAIAYVNARPRPLSLYYFGKDRAEENRVLDRTVAGGVTVNDVVTHCTVESLPFGGVGPSGMGAYHGVEGFRTFSHARSVLRQTGLDVAGMTGVRPPYGKKLARTLRFLIKR